MPELAYLNGTFCPIEQAKVSIEDRGFQFADGVYEVVLYYGDQPLMLDAHFDRLASSCRGINLAIDFEGLKLKSAIAEGVRRAGFEQTMVYIQLTRGPAPRNHIEPAQYDPTVVMTFKAKPVVSDEKRARGLSLITMPDFRWARCDLKTIALLPNVMAKNEARARGYDDALFVGPEGDLRESSAANLFLIRSGHLLTPPTNQAILPGITRRIVLQCAEGINLPVRESTISLEDLMSADEAFLCSTTIDALAVVRVDDQPIGSGRPGELTQALCRQFPRIAKTLQHG